jgi:hypothetical protein
MHLFSDSSSVSGLVTIDVITGASPSGALPSGKAQTVTSASGRTRTVTAGQIPTFNFQDHRGAVDGEWVKKVGSLLTSTLGGHASREKDYQSLGVSGKLSGEFNQRLTTLSIGGSYDDDSVFPVGGTPAGLSTGATVSHASNAKRVSTLVAGVSQILTRRWMLALDATHTGESGYLTEPYKVVSLMDPVTGYPVGQLTDNRPSTRTRDALLLSSVYHLSSDVLYSSYRYYWDSWNVRSHTVDLRYRHDTSGDEDDWWLEPHVRLYRQTAASFFTAGLVAGQPVPQFATADYRLGNLSTLTLGFTVGFHPSDEADEWTVRAELIRLAGDGSPPGVVGVQRSFDLAPPVNTFTLVLGYSF